MNVVVREGTETKRRNEEEALRNYLSRQERRSNNH
jgi:hypothetical protein